MNAELLHPTPSDAALPGPAQSDTETRAMLERLNAVEDRSTAEMLEDLRRSFPDSPLSFRVRALAALLKR